MKRTTPTPATRKAILEPLESPVRLVPTKLVRILLNTRACGEKVHIDVEFMVVISAMAAKKCLVGFRLESVVFRSVTLRI